MMKQLVITIATALAVGTASAAGIRSNENKRFRQLSEQPLPACAEAIYRTSDRPLSILTAG